MDAEFATRLAKQVQMFEEMTARELDGQLRCYNYNKSRGGLSDVYMKAIREVAERRYEEIDAFRLEWKLGPRRAWAEAMAERRKRAAEDEDCIVIKQKTGKGGRKIIRVPRKLAEEAKQRPDSPKAVD